MPATKRKIFNGISFSKEFYFLNKLCILMAMKVGSVDLKLLFFSALLFLSSTALGQGGSFGGNGGDTIRRRFIEFGYESIDWAKHSPAVLNQLPHHAKDLRLLESYLDIRLLKLRKKFGSELQDNGGSKAHAIWKDGFIILDEEVWLNLFREHFDLQKEVFHELLRLARIDDDNYLISKFLLNPYEQKLGEKKCFYQRIELPAETSIQKLSTSGALKAYVLRAVRDISIPSRVSTLSIEGGKLFQKVSSLKDPRRGCSLTMSSRKSYPQKISTYTPLVIDGVSVNFLRRNPAYRIFELKLSTFEGTVMEIHCGDGSYSMNIGELRRRLKGVFELISTDAVSIR